MSGGVRGTPALSVNQTRRPFRFSVPQEREQRMFLFLLMLASKRKEISDFHVRLSRTAVAPRFGSDTEKPSLPAGPLRIFWQIIAAVPSGAAGRRSGGRNGCFRTSV